MLPIANNVIPITRAMGPIELKLCSSISTKAKTVTLKWKKVKCSGYEIQYSTNKSMKNAKKVTASSNATSKKTSKLKKGKTYYFRIRAYKEYTNTSGKTVKCYSSWSPKKSIKCK